MRVYLLLLFFSCGVTAICTPIMRRLSFNLHLLTPLRSRDVHIVPTPRLGGAAMTTGFVLTILLGRCIPFLEDIYQDSLIWAILYGVIAMCILGIVDDIFELDWFTKILGQVIITTVMAFYGVTLVSFPIFGSTVGSGRLSILLSVIISVLIINAVNYTDGLDGLAAGVVAIGAICFYFYAYFLVRQIGLATYASIGALITISLVGACLGFLFYNYHPASIFMGDSGSMVLGLILSSTTIVVTGQVNPVLLSERSSNISLLPILIPTLVVIVPMFDLLATTVGRIIRGKSIFKADRSHLHDKLLNYGRSHRSVVHIIWSWGMYFCLLAILLMFSNNTAVTIWAILGLSLCLGFTYVKITYQKKRWNITISKPGHYYDDGIKKISLDHISREKKLGKKKLRKTKKNLSNK